MITENLSTLKIHKLSQVQYDRELADGNIDGTALYLTPDEATPLKSWSDVDTLTTSGWYRFSGGISVSGISCNYAYMRVDSYNDKQATQTLYLITGGKRYTLVRHLLSGVWESEWSWDNPPCVSGTIYKTTERRNDKPVYMFYAETDSVDSTQAWSVRAMVGLGITSPWIDSLECNYKSAGNGYWRKANDIYYDETAQTINANFGGAIAKATVTMKFY